MTPHPSQMYLQQPLSSIPPTSATYGGLPPYGHPLYDAEPSCFERYILASDQSLCTQTLNESMHICNTAIY